jgi:hypothetical protein
MAFMLSSGVSATGEGFWITGGCSTGFSGMLLSVFLQLKVVAINKKIKTKFVLFIREGVKFI